MLPYPIEGDNLRLFRALPWGPQRGTSVKALMLALSWSDRQVREHLDELATLGFPVVTLPVNNGRSVYLARTPEELTAGIAHLESKVESTQTRIAVLKQTREDWPWGVQQLQMAV